MIEQIKWQDSVSLGGWQYPADMEGWGGRVVTTVGIVVSETESDVVLAMSEGDAGGGKVFCNWLSIPKVAIIDRRKMQ